MTIHRGDNVRAGQAVTPAVTPADAPVPPGVAEALRRIQRGEMVLVSDGPDREDEADLTMAAQWVTPEAIAFMLRHGRGLVCMPCDGTRLDRLSVGPMVTGPVLPGTPQTPGLPGTPQTPGLPGTPQTPGLPGTPQTPDSPGSPPVPGCDTAFTVSIDHRSVGSGISAADRAATIRAVLDPWSGPCDFVRPGHVFPLRAREGGVLIRAGHTEAAVDLARLAGLPPCAVICEVLNDDGTIARGPELDRLAVDHDLARVTIEDLVAFQRAHLRSGSRVSAVS